MLKKIRPSRVGARRCRCCVTLGSILFSGRPVAGYGVSVIEEVMVLPDNGRRAPNALRYADHGSGEMPYPNGRPRRSRREHRSRRRALKARRMPMPNGWQLSMPYSSVTGGGSRLALISAAKAGMSRSPRSERRRALR